MIHRSSKHIVTVLSLFLVLSIYATAAGEGTKDDPIVITTDDALELALSNNIDILAGLAALETARARIATADNRWDPALTASYTYTRLAEVPIITLPGESGVEEDFPIGTADNYLLGVRFYWPIYTGGEREANVRIAKLGVEGLEAQQDVLEDLIGALAQNYCLTLREARGMVVARKKSLEYVNGLVATSEALFEQGLIPKNDLLRTQVEQTNRQQELAAAINDERVTEDELNAFIGFDFGTSVVIEVIGYEPIFFESSLDPFYNLALKQRPEVRALDLQFKVLEEERKAAKSGRLPDVSLTVSFDRAGDTPLLAESGFGEANTLSGTINVTYDIYDGGAVSDTLGELDRRERELDVARKRLEQEIYLELERAYYAIKQAFGDIKAAEKAIVQAEENLRITRRRFEEGLVVGNDVVEAEALHLAANLTYTRSRYNYYRAAALVGKAVGIAKLDYYLELKDTIGLDYENGSEE